MVNKHYIFTACTARMEIGTAERSSRITIQYSISRVGCRVSCGHLKQPDWSAIGKWKACPHVACGCLPFHVHRSDRTKITVATLLAIVNIAALLV